MVGKYYHPNIFAQYFVKIKRAPCRNRRPHLPKTLNNENNCIVKIMNF
jgi:hypothetical protein